LGSRLRRRISRFRRAVFSPVIIEQEALVALGFFSSSVAGWVGERAFQGGELRAVSCGAGDFKSSGPVVVQFQPRGTEHVTVSWERKGGIHVEGQEVVARLCCLTVRI